MRNLLIQSWRNPHASASFPFSTVEILRERLKPATELTDEALARLILRLRGRFPVSLPLRNGADVSTLVTWFTGAGATVVISTPAGASSEPPLQMLASASPSAESPPTQENENN